MALKIGFVMLGGCRASANRSERLWVLLELTPQVSGTLQSMSAHNAEVKGQIGKPYRWHAICPGCEMRSVGWSEDPDEARKIAAAHAEAENSWPPYMAQPS